MYRKAHDPKRLADIRNDFERGVFLALYNSREQRIHRWLACGILVVKHSLRGLLFSWPLYLLPLAAWALQARYLPLILVLLLPGLLVSGLILRRGIREDCSALVDGHILRAGYAGRMLFPGSFRSPEA
jgi:hypothetical protein